ncbi:MAG: acyl-CoA mutase large subunit family protein [Firmicutes bacterium]|nr:acyl-CoA mutase large subunit family protein [Bacillota bacterium]
MDKQTFFAEPWADIAAGDREKWMKQAAEELRLADKTAVLPELQRLAAEPPSLPPVGYPGQGDLRRGVSAAGFWAKPWRIAWGTPEVLPHLANAALKESLALGANAVSLDGSAGLYTETVEDMMQLMDGIDLTALPLHVYTGATAIPFLSLLKLQSLQSGSNGKAYWGCVGSDPLGEYAKKGNAAAGLDCYLDQWAATMRWQVMSMPKVRCILLRGSVYHNGGASAAGELACLAAASMEYIDGLLERDMDMDDIARQFRWEVTVSGDFAEDVAKLRAARMLWAKLIRAYGGSVQAQALDLATVESSFYTLPQEPAQAQTLRMLRAAASIAGGADLHLLQAAEGDMASLLACRPLWQSMAEHMPPDPWGGANYLEYLTREIAEEAWRYWQKLDQAGGMQEALFDGMVQDDIEKTFRQKAEAKGVAAAAGSHNPQLLPGRQFSVNQEVRLARTKALAEHNKNVDARMVAQDLAKVDGCVCTAMAAFTVGATTGQVLKALNKGASFPSQGITDHRGQLPLY